LVYFTEKCKILIGYCRMAYTVRTRWGKVQLEVYSSIHKPSLFCMSVFHDMNVNKDCVGIPCQLKIDIIAGLHQSEHWIWILKLQWAKNSCCIHSICLTLSLVKFQVLCGIVVKDGFQFPVFKNGYVLQIRLVYIMTGISLCKIELHYSCIYC
jgi:hypothetical protein